MYAKKLLVVLCAFAVAFGAEAANFHFEYTDNEDGTVTLTGVSGTVPSTLKVPMQIGGKNVSEVGYGFMSKDQKVSSIVISEGVRKIGEKAFCDCHSLESIVIPKTVAEIGDKAFVSSRAAVSGQMVGGLSSLVVSPDNEFFEVVSGVLIDRKKGRAIVACANVCAVSLPEGVTTICDMAFCGCTELRTIQFPASLMTIEGDKNFGACFSLETVDFHKTSLVEIGEQAFALCKKLKAAWFPSSLERIGSYAFSWCDVLTRVQFDGREPIIMQVDKHDSMFPFGDIYVTSDSFDMSSNGVGPFTKHLDRVITCAQPGKGWDDIVASGTWQGRPIEFIDGEIPQGGDVDPGDWTVAHNFSGVVYDVGENCVGMIQIATKKATKKGVGVSGTMMLQDGKKITLKSMTVAPEGGVLNVSWTVKGYGKLNVTVGAEGFSGQFEDGGSVESQELDEDTGVLKASITMTYIDKKTGKMKTKKITFGGFVSGGEGVGTVQASKKDPIKDVEFTVR